MGRTTAKRGSRAAVVGPTPSSANEPFGAVHKHQRRQAMEDDVAMHKSSDKGGPAQPAKITVNKFFTAVPRTAILEDEGPDAGPAIKKDTAAPPVGLGELSAAIWANTSVSKGGAKGPSERASVALTMLLDEKAALDEGGEQAALMSTNGLLAYAQEMIWGVRMPDEADDAPFDADDPLQVAGRLKVLWKDWRKLPHEQQKAWGDKQLAHDAAAALKRATCGSSKPKTKLRHAAASVSTAEHDLAIPMGQSRGSRRKPDGWSFVPPPQHRRNATKGELRQLKELEELEDEEADVQQEAKKEKKKRGPAGSKQRSGRGAAVADEGDGDDAAAEVNDASGRAGAEQTKLSRDGAADPDDGTPGGADEQEFDERFRRAAALAKHNKKALLAEMKIWEDEAQEQEQATAAGISVEELHRRKKAEAAGAALVPEGNQHQDDAAGPSSKAATAKKKKKKTVTGAAKKGSSTGGSSRRAGKQKTLPEDDSSDEEVDAVADDMAADKAREAARRQRGRRPAAEAASKKLSAAAVLQAAGDEDEMVVDHEEDALEQDKACVADKRGSKKASAVENAADQAVVPSAKAAKAAKAAAGTGWQADTGRATAGKASEHRQPGSKKRTGTGPADAAPADLPGGAAGASAAAGGKRRKTGKAGEGAAPSGSAGGQSAGDTAAAGKAAGQQQQQQSPSRRSTRTTKAEADDGPAASGAGPSSAPRRGRSASTGGAAVAQLDHLEKTLFSNTRRSSYGRADSPGLVAMTATAHHHPTPAKETAAGGGKSSGKRGSSRMNK